VVKEKNRLSTIPRLSLGRGIALSQKTLRKGGEMSGRGARGAGGADGGGGSDGSSWEKDRGITIVRWIAGTLLDALAAALMFFPLKWLIEVVKPSNLGVTVVLIFFAGLFLFLVYLGKVRPLLFRRFPGLRKWIGEW